MALSNRKSTRLKNYDYSQNGYYFLTICTHNRKRILCDIVGGGAFDAPKIILSKYGEIVDKYILSTNNIPNITVDKYIIMPNHIHLLLLFENTNGTSRAPSPTNNIISHSISTLKRFVNKEIGYNIFQRSFYDHIIRGEKDYLKIWNYIDKNHLKWKEDCFYVE
ncbi:MAG: transposase [Clostridia bacterium]|nr:transposase [Clostridia bacterium]